MKQEEFAVDASLLRELGERLIGRPAIALGELIKNSYDADARHCEISFGDDKIIISDDGTGMSETEFLKHWMRIGTTHKVDTGRSKKLRRAFTGSKGVGRLSVQFLADEMTMESSSERDAAKQLYVTMDWRKAVRGTDLDTVKVLWESRNESSTYAAGSTVGTRIELKKLKTTWDGDAIGDLGRDVWMLRSPFKLFAKRTSAEDTDFDIQLDAPDIEGAREAFDQVMTTLFSRWKARIRGTLENGRTGNQGARLSVVFKEDYPDKGLERQVFRETVHIPTRRSDPEHKNRVNAPLIDRCKFEILVFKPEGKQAGGINVADMREYLAEYGNVSVYDTGFRLPYYGAGREAAGQDWLGIAIDQGRRLNASELLPSHLQGGTNLMNRYMQDLPAPGRIFGAVDIDTNHERSVAEGLRSKPGEWLQIQSGRDRLHDNEAFGQLRDLVRFSLDLYANRHRQRALESVEKHRDQEPPSTKYDRALEALEDNKDHIPANVFKEVRREIADARRASVVEEADIDRRASLLAPLASAGMAALALNHELSREGAFLGRVGDQLRRLSRKHAIPELRSIADEFEAAKQRLESLQELFAPLLSDIDKAATDRLKVRAVVQQAVDSMKVLMPSVKMDDLSKIPTDLRFPLGSLAEWNALLQNVLSNAWNAMLESVHRRIFFRGGRDGKSREWLHVSDTGQGLDIPLDEAAKLFEPFERRLQISDEKRSIALGGQGLGLAIVRMIARRRNAKVAFVEPEDGYSTTFEISWKG